MRTIPGNLQAALDTGATTLARCWKVTRRDGLELGFTDHDRALAFDGVTFEPDSGFSPSAIDAATGLAVDTHDVSGALHSDRISDVDLVKGLYDGAEVALYLVDWTDVESRILLSRGHVGEIRRGEESFEAEIRGLSDRLNQPTGPVYMPTCACRLGETKCGVDLGAPGVAGDGTVLAQQDPQRVTATDLDGFADGWFNGGLLTWTSGANAGVEGHVKAHHGGTESVIELWRAPPMPTAAGDTFHVTAGCDKTLATCAEKFGNVENFRGFPHMPGDDVAASYPSTGGTHDGGSLFRS